VSELHGREEAQSLASSAEVKADGKGYILDEVIAFFILSNPLSCTMALGLTHPLTEGAGA
jgi:phosphatidylglycerophosphatase A